MFKKIPYNAERFVNKDFDEALIKLLGKIDFDIVQLEGLYVRISKLLENTARL